LERRNLLFGSVISEKKLIKYKKQRTKIIFFTVTFFATSENVTLTSIAPFIMMQVTLFSSTSVHLPSLPGYLGVGVVVDGGATVVGGSVVVVVVGRAVVVVVVVGRAVGGVVVVVGPLAS
jgi:hypothetical protein